MPRTKGAKQFSYELPEEDVDAFREFARSRGQTVSHVLLRAIRRYMAYPEPVASEPPLTPYPDPARAGEIPADAENPPPARAKKRKA